ncbi:MAG: nucleotidyltransferase [Bacteroidetes bacterium 4572_77]|nr:MAG: nucleotidyltransferase [Bacteroidetes bacterium 4572_77]
MTSDKDIRWEYRFSNFNKALSKLNEAILLNQERKLSELEKQGLIQVFEYTHELAWRVMQDFLIYQGYTEIRGSRDATREAFRIELVTDGDNWMEMIKKRNLTSHTYNEETSQEIYRNIIKDFHPLFIEFQEVMERIKVKESNI